MRSERDGSSAKFELPMKGFEMHRTTAAPRAADAVAAGPTRNPWFPGPGRDDRYRLQLSS